MVSVRSFTGAAVMAAAVAAEQVACKFNGETVATVDSETGKCPFTIPDSLPVNFDFTSPEEYLVDAYYAKGDDKYWNDIPNAGRVIEIPVPQLVQKKIEGLFHVHLEETPGANSTLKLRKRLFGDDYMFKRDDVSDLVAKVQAEDGEAVAGNPLEGFSVEPLAASDSASASGSASATASATGSGAESASATGSGAESASASASASGSDSGDLETVIESIIHTSVKTIYSCSDHKCEEKTQILTECPTTSTNDEGAVITTTIWKPQQTVIIEIYDEQCGCHKEVPATEGIVTSTITKGSEEKTVEIITWCPVPSQEVVTKTICFEDKCSQHVVITDTEEKPATKTQGPTEQPEHVVTVTVCESEQCKPVVTPGVVVTQPEVDQESTIYITKTVPATEQPQEQLSTATNPPPNHTTYIPGTETPEAPKTLEGESKTAPVPTTVVTGVCETCVPEVAPSKSAAPQTTSPVITPIEGAAAGLSVAKVMVAVVAAIPLFL